MLHPPPLDPALQPDVNVLSPLPPDKVPLLSLPVDVVLGILKILASDEHEFESDDAPESYKTQIIWQNKGPFYRWVAVTQFCRQWRSIAMEFPVLWTRIDARNVYWATEFLQRSQDLPISVDTRRHGNSIGYGSYGYEPHKFDRLTPEKPFVDLILSQAHRVRSLYACEWFPLRRFTELPQLEVLTLSNFGTSPLDPRFLVRYPAEASAMWYHLFYLPSLPRLKWLKIHNCLLFTVECSWGVNFPRTLPSLTHLYLRVSKYLNPAEILERCPNLHTLSLACGLHDEAACEGGAGPIRIPTLRRLEYRNVNFGYTRLFQAPIAVDAYTKITYQTGEHTAEDTPKNILDIIDPLLSDPAIKPDSFHVQAMQYDGRLALKFIGKRSGVDVCQIILVGYKRENVKRVEDLGGCLTTRLDEGYNIATTISPVKGVDGIGLTDDHFYRFIHV